MTSNLVESQDPFDLLQVLLGDLQALLLGQAAFTGQTGAEQQLGAVVHLPRRKNRVHVRDGRKVGRFSVCILVTSHIKYKLQT